MFLTKLPYIGKYFIKKPFVPKDPSGYKCDKCGTELCTLNKYVCASGYYCHGCKSRTVNYSLINYTINYRIGQLALEIMSKTHDPKNVEEAIEIMCSFYKRYCSDLYDLAEQLERYPDEISKELLDTIRLFYGVKENYYDYRNISK